jgi:hypothetical protein
VSRSGRGREQRTCQHDDTAVGITHRGVVRKLNYLSWNNCFMLARLCRLCRSSKLGSGGWASIGPSQSLAFPFTFSFRVGDDHPVRQGRTRRNPSLKRGHVSSWIHNTSESNVAEPDDTQHSPKRLVPRRLSQAPSRSVTPITRVKGL